MLDTKQFALADYLGRARANGVESLLSISVDLNEFSQLLAIAEQFPQVSISVGQHPNEVMTPAMTFEQMLVAARQPCVVAIGETGLDYYRGKDHALVQQQSLREHIRLAKIVGKPLVIHTRHARADTIAILREEKADEIGGVLHCFTEDLATAEQAMALNFHISFSGIVTFKNALELQAVAKIIPLSRLLIETDSPFLAPVPHRGHANEPAFVRHVAEFIANLRGQSLNTIAAHTTENFYQLFKVKRPQASALPVSL